MDYHAESAAAALKALGSDAERGLGDAAAKKSAEKYGKNVIERKKGKGLFARIGEALC